MYVTIVNKKTTTRIRGPHLFPCSDVRKRNVQKVKKIKKLRIDKNNFHQEKNTFISLLSWSTLPQHNGKTHNIINNNNCVCYECIYITVLTVNNNHSSSFKLLKWIFSIEIHSSFRLHDIKNTTYIFCILFVFTFYA